jgi:hypothetical protein
MQPTRPRHLCHQHGFACRLGPCNGRVPGFGGDTLTFSGVINTDALPKDVCII